MNNPQFFNKTPSTSPTQNTLSLAQQQQIILHRLLLAHEACFDIEKNYSFAGKIFPGYGEFRSREESYILSKKAIIWGIDTFEYLFFYTTEFLTENELHNLTSFIIKEGLKKVRPGPEHMTSYLSLIIIAQNTDDSISKIVRKTKFRKNFKFQLEGWTELKLGVIDVSLKKITVNNAAKDMKNTLEYNTTLLMKQNYREGGKK